MESKNQSQSFPTLKDSFLSKCCSQIKNGKFIVFERLDYLFYHPYYGNSKREIASGLTIAHL